MTSVTDSLMSLIKSSCYYDTRSINGFMKEEKDAGRIEINKVCSNGYTVLGAAAETGNLALVKWLLESCKLNNAPLKNNRNNRQAMKLDLSNSSNGGEFKKSNIGYFCVCRDAEELGEGPTPDGMEALEWDMEVQQHAKQQESLVQASDNLYHWYADILSRTALLMKSPEYDISSLDNHSCNVLHYAVLSGNTELVAYLLNTYPMLEIDQPGHKGMTPLHMATSRCHLYKMAAYLVEKGANIHAVNHDRRTPLHEASICSSLEVVEMLIAFGADLNVTDLNDRTPLSLSVQRGCYSIVKVLVESGVRINVEEADGSTPLSRAVEKNNVKVAHLLLDYGARIINSQFLLHSSARTGNLQMMEVLLMRSFVIINTRDLEGNTPLMVACTCGHASAVKLLLENGGMPNYRNNISGLTALHMCIKNVDNVGTLKAMIKALVEAGGDVNVTSCQGSPLWFAVALKKFTAATLLIQNGAYIDLRDERTRYDILSMVRKKKADDSLVQLLIYAGYNMKKVFTPPNPKERNFSFLCSVKNSPMTLRDLCRICIRRSIGPERYISKVHRLPLPELMQEYLTFEKLVL